MSRSRIRHRPISGTPRRDAEGLRALLAVHDKVLCDRCECCELVYRECHSCAGEGSWEDESDPTWGTETVPCDVCGGAGGWQACIGPCDEAGRHKPLPRRGEACDGYSWCDGRPFVAELVTVYLDDHVSVHRYCAPCLHESRSDAESTKRRGNGGHIWRSERVTWLTTLLDGEVPT